ncbi:Uncharacterised protein [Legionella busanensis]|uniref:Lipoprotein n=1 Tax=Legionella busanensis TaxID=190655 RepID=A0A378JIM6_9GAMM|nr:hypothetical protein [Legionella busanensis]STX51004.1 Uncharacterised protein [Legionella busanensis]
MKKISTALFVLGPTMFLSGCVTDSTYTSRYNTSYYPGYSSTYVYGTNPGYSYYGYNNMGYYGNRGWYGNRLGLGYRGLGVGYRGFGFNRVGRWR